MPTLSYDVGASSLTPYVALEWIGAPHDAIKVQFGSKDMLTFNSAGAVPTLREDDGWLLTQASGTLDYLASKHSEAGLAGGDGVCARAKAYHWSAFITLDLHASFWPTVMPYRYTTDEGEAAQQAVAETGYKLVTKQFAILNRRLDGREHILDEGRSVTDAYSLPTTRQAINPLSGGLKEYPNVQLLHHRIAADLAVQKALTREAGK